MNHEDVIVASRYSRLVTKAFRVDGPHNTPRQEGHGIGLTLMELMFALPHSQDEGVGVVCSSVL